MLMVFSAVDAPGGVGKADPPATVGSVNELSSMVVPLETLPGWPNVQDPSILQVLGLLVGAPLVVILLVAAVTRIHHAVKGNVGTPAVMNQPVWVNGRRIESASETVRSDSDRESIAAGHRAINERLEREREDDKGGAGARW